MKKYSLRIYFIISLCLLLSACGFHLRGEEALPPQLQTLFIDAAPYAPLTLNLKQSLKSADVNIVDARSKSPLTLQILNENLNQSVVNISGNTLVKTYKLDYTVQFQLLNKAKGVIYGPTSVHAVSTYYLNDNQILGDNQQLENQKAILRRQIIGLIFNRLGSQDVRTALAKQ